MDINVDFQKSLYNHLKSQLTDIEFYTHIPTGAVMPYAQIQFLQTARLDTKMQEAEVLTIQIDLYQDQPSNLQGQEHATLIKAALHRQDIPLNSMGYRLIDLQCQQERLVTLDQGRVQNRQLTFSAILESES